MRSDLARYQFAVRLREQGSVVSVGDGIAWLEGLPSAALDQMVIFEDGLGSRGMVFDLAEDRIGVIVLDDSNAIVSGTRVRLDTPLTIPTGDALLGRVVDPLCRTLDGKGPLRLTGAHTIDGRAPSIAERDFVHEPLYTGNAIVDTMLPIGRGQRQLLIGDRSLGKTALALDTIVAQKDSGVLCVYVLIGQRRSAVMEIIGTLRRAGVLDQCVVVVAEADAAPGLQYIAPYSGCTIAEEWMQRGRHTLIVYDDLTRHAQAYRSLSLLLRRPPGREAYPGDIFFLHSRLLERSTVFSPERGGGSLTALPIIQTEEGEIAAYIPTNLISITDGQLYFSRELFTQGALPAIDVTKSVSRVGGNAQEPAVRTEAGRMRLEYLQFLELEKFARLGTRLEQSTAERIKRGRVLREILKQERLAPRMILFDLAWMIAYNERLFDNSSPDDVKKTLASLESCVQTAGLTLMSDRARWVEVLQTWRSGIHDEQAPPSSH